MGGPSVFGRRFGFRRGVRFSEAILFPWRILLKSTCAAMEWRLLGLSRLLGLPPGWERGPADLFAPVPGRNDGSTALGLGNWNILQGFWRALMAIGSGCPGGDLHPSRAWWTGLGLGFSEALCLARGLFPLLGGPFLGLPLCVPELSAYPVFIGTRLTARLVWNGGEPRMRHRARGTWPPAVSLGRGGVCFPCASASARTRAGSALWLRLRQVWAPPGALASILFGWR